MGRKFARENIVKFKECVLQKCLPKLRAINSRFHRENTTHDLPKQQNCFTEILAHEFFKKKSN